MSNANNANDLKPAGIVLSGADAGYLAASRSAAAVLHHIAAGNADNAYLAARQAASVMSAVHLYF